ncbi:RNA polymerase sigma factor [Pseudomonas sp. MT3]|uniref:RNA polymerase sigma factor n=1 Tax=Pseudomonas sp. ATCC 13867 TaxID=1294143 RepID=UPI0002C4E0D5|nr:RNA polymerase sigma factor [Pseudomonas sp. ATCC 13867]AGI23527.1 putative DNA-binding protein [Pseudomonas sp. ATCC 13867]RFQ42145.1 RNA polymerase sigma factor [Pseudomonas sp. ATCC 13867]
MDERFSRSVSQVYRSFHGELLRFLRRQLNGSADAADLAQDAFAQWLKSSSRHDVEQPRAFLFQVARNLLRDHWRRQHKAAEVGEPELGGEADLRPAAEGGEPVVQLERQRYLRRLSEALDSLPPRRREAFVLHKFEGLSQPEVARRMGISLSMVEKHVASALLHCKRHVQGEGEA